MKYLLDTNSLNLQVLRESPQRNDVCTIQDVIDEHTSHGSKASRIDGTGIEVLQIRAKHLLVLQRILADEGANFDLIRLFTAEGMADAMIVAFVVAEREVKDTLFDEDYIVVTNDTGLRAVATRYQVTCVTTVP